MQIFGNVCLWKTLLFVSAEIRMFESTDSPKLATVCRTVRTQIGACQRTICLGYPLWGLPANSDLTAQTPEPPVINPCNDRSPPSTVISSTHLLCTLLPPGHIVYLYAPWQPRPHGSCPPLFATASAAIRTRHSIRGENDQRAS